MMTTTHTHTPQPSSPAPTRFAWLSIAAAVITIAVKFAAYMVTGSVGLLSDALESVVNLVTAILTLIILGIAVRPPDEEHAYGHSKAEYFSSAAEGIMIVGAAVSIIASAVPRLLAPQPLESAGLGLALSLAATLVNLVVAQVLLRASRTHSSIALEGESHHLMTDVYTSGGVLVGILLVTITGIERLDPIIALLVALNIIWSGVKLMRSSADGLMDAALPAEDRQTIIKLLDRYVAEQQIGYHALRTRMAGARRFASMHILVPDTWTVSQGHDIVEQIERDIREALPGTTVFTHLEPIEDPSSFEDTSLDRSGA